MTFLNKDFTKMGKDELKKTYVHDGIPEVTSRTYDNIIGEEYNLKKAAILQGILVTLWHNADFPLNAILSLEYGEKLAKIGELSDDMTKYLTETPSEMITADHQHIVIMAQSLFRECVQVSRTLGF